MKKFWILLFIITNSNGFTQNSHDDYLNQQKYWYYRERLKYFVVPGTNPGESMIAGIRNGGIDKGLDFGQHSVYLGYYLGVLATEYYLLKYYNQDVTNTYNEIDLALNAYIEQMDKCENRCYGLNDKYDGFFIRNDVSCNLGFFDNSTELGQYHLKALNKNLTDQDIWNPTMLGHPGYTSCVRGCPDCKLVSEEDNNACYPMSQDEAIGLLKGLALVHRCLPLDDPLNFRSCEIAIKIINYMAFNYMAFDNSPFTAWFIHDPNGAYIGLDNGGEVITYSYPLSITAGYFGFSPSTYWIDPNTSSGGLEMLAWDAQQYFVCTNSTNYTVSGSMSASLAAMCDCWTEYFTGIPINSSGAGIKTVSTCNDWDGFYLMLLEFLHGQRSPFLTNDIKSEIQDQIDAAPCEGPYYYDKMGSIFYSGFGGWAGSYKYEICRDKQDYGDPGAPGTYNGLDYMLLHNLYYILEIHDYNQGIRNPKVMPPFYNMMDEHCSSNYPLDFNTGFSNVIMGNNEMPTTVNAFNTIVSSDLIDTECHYFDNNNQEEEQPTNCIGNVTYRAGESIRLVSGFNAKEGTFFHAYIGPFSCVGSEYRSSGQQYNYGIDSNSIVDDGYLKNLYESKDIMTFLDNIPTIDTSAINNNSNDSIGGTYFGNSDSTIIRVSPNPLSEYANIIFYINYDTPVTITITDVYGILIKQVVSENFNSGSHTILLNASDLNYGIYMCCLQTSIERKCIQLVVSQ